MNHVMSGSVGNGTDTVTHYFSLNHKEQCRIKAQFFLRFKKWGDEQNRDYALIQEGGGRFSWRSSLPSSMVSPLFLTDLVSLQFLDFYFSPLICLSGIKQAIFFQSPSCTSPVQSSLWITSFSKETVQVKNQDVSQVLQIPHSKPHLNTKGRI